MLGIYLFQVSDATASVRGKAAEEEDPGGLFKAMRHAWGGPNVRVW